MSKILKTAALHPLFKPTLAAGISGITTGAQLLITLGIDVTDEVIAVLRKIEQILRDATYDSIDLDALLKTAQEIGDDRDAKKREESSETFGPSQNQDSPEGNLG